MDIALYIIIFIMGTVFGSFLTLATYRIPLHKNITHEHSFCPSCNHKLSFLDLIPVWSYIILGGKCRYCKKKIGSRYFIIEITTGIAFVILAYILEINIMSLTITKCIDFAIACLYIVFLYLIAGIDIKYRKVYKSVVIYGFVIACINLVFQFMTATSEGYIYNLNRVMIYLIIIILLLMFNIESVRKTKKYDYCIDLILVSIIMCMFTYEITTILSVIGCLLAVTTNLLINKILNKGNEKNINKMPVAFYLVVSNMLVFVSLYFYTMLV